MKQLSHLTVACEHCDKRHRVQPKQIGKQGNCKRCGKSFEIRPKQAQAKPDLDVSVSEESTEHEYYIPVSLTSSPMVDQEYQKNSRAQTNFTNFPKLPERKKATITNAFIFLSVLLVLAGCAFLLYWFVIRQ